MQQILKPIESPYPQEIADALSTYPQRDGYILKLFRVFANSYRFLTGKGVLNLLDKDSPLSLRQRELIILRICANNHCEYEWGVHVAAYADHAGFTEQEIALTCRREISPSDWGDDEAVLLQAVDQLCDNGHLQAEVKHRFTELWNLEQQLEILALCGNYHTISFVANLSELPMEPFAVRFPDQVRVR